MVNQNMNVIQNQPNNVQQWFDEMVTNLRYDQTLLEIDVLEENKKSIYNTLISGNQDMISHLGRQTSTAYFISKIVSDYFKELVKTKSKPKKIALELSDSKILVWAEVSEDDEVMEDGLILTEAKINAEYSKYGFHISSTIVEDCDGLPIPSHYKSVPIN
jgi:hypothetical protein